MGDVVVAIRASTRGYIGSRPTTEPPFPSGPGARV